MGGSVEPLPNKRPRPDPGPGPGQPADAAGGGGRVGCGLVSGSGPARLCHFLAALWEALHHPLLGTIMGPLLPRRDLWTQGCQCVWLAVLGEMHWWRRDLPLALQCFTVRSCQLCCSDARH